jgi:hypothetical protein
MQGKRAWDEGNPWIEEAKSAGTGAVVHGEHGVVFI